MIHRIQKIYKLMRINGENNYWCALDSVLFKKTLWYCICTVQCGVWNLTLYLETKNTVGVDTFVCLGLSFVCPGTIFVCPRSIFVCPGTFVCPGNSFVCPGSSSVCPEAGRTASWQPETIPEVPRSSQELPAVARSSENSNFSGFLLDSGCPRPN